MFAELRELLGAKIKQVVVERSERTESLLNLKPESIDYETSCKPPCLPESEPGTPKRKVKKRRIRLKKTDDFDDSEVEEVDMIDERL